MATNLREEAAKLNESELKDARIKATARILQEMDEEEERHHNAIKGLKDNLGAIEEMKDLKRLLSIGNARFTGGHR